MSVHSIFYLTCTGCGRVHCDDEGRTVYSEEPEEVRDDAEDNGWQCYVGDEKAEDQRDYCGDCRTE